MHSRELDVICHRSCPDPFSCIAACADLRKLVVGEEGHKQKRGATQRSALTRCPSARVPATLYAVPKASDEGYRCIGGIEPPISRLHICTYRGQWQRRL